jgi:hypothetical protein
MNKRKAIDQEEFDLKYLQKVMRTLFPKRNDCASMQDLEEVVGELKHFSSVTKLQVRLFLKKYRRQLLDIDKSPLDSCHQRIYREDLGDEQFLDAMRRQYWFCYPAIIRIAMEINFGDEYEKYSNERDGI